MFLRDRLMELLGGGKQPQQQPKQQQRGGIHTQLPGLQRRGNEVHVNRGISDGPVQEDNFTFEPGGSFTPIGGGRAALNGARYLPGKFQEDDFSFPRQRVAMDNSVMGTPSYDANPEQYAAPQSQGYGEGSYFNTPIQGLQNHGNVGMQGGYGRRLQEPNYGNVNQDPYAKYRQIRF